MKTVLSYKVDSPVNYTSASSVLAQVQLSKHLNMVKRWRFFQANFVGFMVDVTNSKFYNANHVINLQLNDVNGNQIQLSDVFNSQVPVTNATFLNFDYFTCNTYNPFETGWFTDNVFQLNTTVNWFNPIALAALPASYTGQAYMQFYIEYEN